MPPATTTATTRSPIRRRAWPAAPSWDVLRSRAHGPDGNGNFIPDCNLSNPDAQNNLAARGFVRRDQRSQLRHGDLSRNFDPAALEGGVRPADWEFGVSVQQEVLPRVGRGRLLPRWLDNFFVDDNLATVPADFTPFSITAPSDSRLPDGGGYTINASTTWCRRSSGRSTTTSPRPRTSATWYQHYNGILLNVTARPRNGLTMQGGLLTDKPCATCAESGTPTLS